MQGTESHPKGLKYLPFGRRYGPLEVPVPLRAPLLAKRQIFSSHMGQTILKGV